MLKAIVLDFDGLIIDTERVWFEVYSAWFREHYRYEMTVEEFLLCVGSHPDDLAEAFREKGMDIDKERFKRETSEVFIRASRALPELPGVSDFVKAVKGRGLSLALATSAGLKKPRFHLERLGLLEDFDLLVTSEDVANIKPEPDLFLEVARQLGLACTELLVVEDSLNGLIAAQRAGIRAAIVPNAITRHSDFPGAYRIYASLRQVDLDELIEDFK